MTTDTTGTTAGSADLAEIRDHAGVRIGWATPGGIAVDFAGVRIGTVDADGAVRDFAGVRTGRCATPR